METQISEEQLEKEFNTFKTLSIELSVAELRALNDYAFKKMCYLEEAHLTDAVCYGLYSKLHYTLINIIDINS